MSDVVTKQTRSRMMAGIRSRHTKPELLVRKALHARGFRYSLRLSTLFGKPDIVLPRWKVAIFVHGCFWHSHGCHLSKLPSSNTEFWDKKLHGNQSRDAMVISELVRNGWRVAKVWECATRGKTAQQQFPSLIDILEDWIRNEKHHSLIELSSASIDEVKKIETK